MRASLTLAGGMSNRYDTSVCHRVGLVDTFVPRSAFGPTKSGSLLSKIELVSGTYNEAIPGEIGDRGPEGSSGNSQSMDCFKMEQDIHVRCEL